MEVPANYYDYGIANDLFQFIWHKTRFKFINGLAPSGGKKILDVGCQAGTFTEQISLFYPGSRVWAVDVSKKAIEYGKKKRNNIDFSVANAQGLPFSNSFFDNVFCLEMLEHVEKPAKVLAEISRVLKRNGRLVILVPSESLLFRIIWFFWTRGRGKVWRGTHINNLGGELLNEVININGFKIEREKFSHLGMLRALVVRKVK